MSVTLIETANSAAVELLAPRSGHLIGQSVSEFLAPPHYALQGPDRPSSVRQCSVEAIYLGKGKPFLALVRFSTYKQGMTPNLAAIVTGVTEQQKHRLDSVGHEC